MIQALGLTKWTNDSAIVDHVSFHVKRGEVYCLLGADGAGKSLLDMFLGFAVPTSGSALVAGHDCLKKPRAARASILYLPASVALSGSLSPLENLRYQCRQTGAGPPSDAEARNLLREMGIPDDLFKSRSSLLSRSQMQRMGLAIAAARRVPVVIADDPAAGIRPRDAEFFLERLIRLKSAGVAILYATSDAYVARQIADRVGILKQGLLILELKKSELAGTDLESLYRSTSPHAALTWPTPTDH
jgi:ABC-2 type transport system ATP-binding protein